MSTLDQITARVRALSQDIPSGVQIVAAAKTRTAAEIEAALAGGPVIIGHNYLQELEGTRPLVKRQAKWHFIGHLQRRKVKACVALADMIETLDNETLAHEIEKRCAQSGRIMPVLLEINSGREPQKHGILPEEAENLLGLIATLPHIRVEGLMTMGPFTDDPEELRPCFRETAALAAHLDSLSLPGVSMRCLSMGMSNSYRIAIEEGATIVRLGTLIFGER